MNMLQLATIVHSGILPVIYTCTYKGSCLLLVYMRSSTHRFNVHIAHTSVECAFDSESTYI